MSPAERAKRYRDQAAEIRAAAALAKTPDVRRTLLEIADSYETLASRVEAPEGASRKPGKPVPVK
jgi:hypothetical protein